jgi:hypothetical protein
MTKTSEAPKTEKITWTLVKANGGRTVTKLKAGGTPDQYLATATALRAAGFTTIIDQHGQCILCDGRHCGPNAARR